MLSVFYRNMNYFQLLFFAKSNLRIYTKRKRWKIDEIYLFLR